MLTAIKEKAINITNEKPKYDTLFENNLVVVDNLTRMEREVVKLLTDGMTDKEIGRKLFIAYSTVKNHKSNIYRQIYFPENVNKRVYLIKLYTVYNYTHTGVKNDNRN